MEVKSGSAIRTPQQKKIDEELVKSKGFNTVGQRAIDANITKISGVMVVHIDNSGKKYFE